MRITNNISILFIFALSFAVFQLGGGEARAESAFFSTYCAGCHTAPATATCNGCHAHGTHSSSSKSDINVKGATDATSYAPGATVTVTITGGYRTGWIRAVLLDQNKVELARSTGNASDMGSSTTYPATLSAPAPTTPGTYTWKVGWYGNKFDLTDAGAGTTFFGTGWTPDPSNPNHGYEIVNTNSFTVVAAADTTAPVVSAFTLPATATNLTILVSSFTATDNVAVTGYLITTSATAPAASATGWSATAPASVVASSAGSTTFYAWAKDAAGNVSAAKSATVVITLPDTIAPVVNTFTLPATTTNLTIPVSSLTATDNVAVTGYLITTSATAPAANATGWTASAPTSVTAAAAGTVTFYAWAKDAAGNVSAAKSASVNISVAPASLTLTVSTLADGSYTNVGTLNINGSAIDTAGIQSITVNGQAVTVNADGSFSTAVTLQTGANTITIVATDNAGTQKTDARTITFDPNAPVLAISAPADNSTTTQSLVTVTGTISETSTVSVSVNGGSPQAAAISGNTYSATVYLVAGVNTISINATDLAGNTATAKRTVTYTSSNSLTLAVTYPSQDITTKNSSLVLTGKVVDQEHVTVKITMNGNTYTPTVDDGVFQQRLTFKTPNLYAITVTATDDAGNSSTVVRNVIYKPGYNRKDN